MTVFSTALATPVGELNLLARGEVLVATGFCPAGELRERLGGEGRLRASADLGELSAAVAAYLEGELGALDGIPVEQSGTSFQEAVWRELRRIPAGRPLRYSELAARLGREGGARAVGGACSANLVALVVPCHRVVGKAGLGGYRYGNLAKRWLLAHEGALE